MADIGQAIAGPSEEEQQQQSKLQTFFKDPKNLATMLVLGAAIAQPRQRGASPLAHALRGGVGALGFRGALDQGITQQRMAEAEAAREQAEFESEAEYRTEDIATRRQQIEARQSQAAMDLISDREQRALLQRLERMGLQAKGTQQDALFKAIIGKAYEQMATAMADPMNRDMSREELIKRFVEPAFMLASMANALPEGLVGGFEPVPGPEETVVQPTGEVEETPPVASPPYGGLKVPGRSERSVRSTLSAPDVTRIVAKDIKRRYPAEAKDTPDESIMNMVAQIQELTQQELDAGMSQQRAQELRRDKFKYDMLSREQQRQVAAIAAARAAVSTPRGI